MRIWTSWKGWTEGKPQSGVYDKDQNVGGKEGSRAETSQRKGPEGGIFALSQVGLIQWYAWKPASHLLFAEGL